MSKYIAPKGYEIITTGKVRTNDLCFADGEWKHPTKTDYKVLGSDVRNYYCVARKLKA